MLTSLTSAARQAIAAYASREHARKPSHNLPHGKSCRTTLKIGGYLHPHYTPYNRFLRISLPKATAFHAKQSLCPGIRPRLPHSSIIQYSENTNCIISSLGSLC